MLITGNCTCLLTSILLVYNDIIHCRHVVIKCSEIFYHICYQWVDKLLQNMQSCGSNVHWKFLISRMVSCQHIHSTHLKYIDHGSSLPTWRLLVFAFIEFFGSMNLGNCTVLEICIHAILSNNLSLNPEDLKTVFL